MNTLTWQCPHCGSPNVEYAPYPVIEFLCEVCSTWTAREVAQTMPIWDVVCGNIGTVYSGTDEDEARAQYGAYMRLSQGVHGRATGEDVTLMCDGDIADKYSAPVLLDDSTSTRLSLLAELLGTDEDGE